MTLYHGNSAYCYANSASMLLSTIGEHISPSLIEVLTGFSLGASHVRNQMLFFDNCTSSPDKGVNRAFEILGFRVIEKVSHDEGKIPLDELREDLSKSPVMMGPFDMGYLNYNPDHRFLGGCDHYTLALEMSGNDVLMHDPAGFPYVWLSFEQLDLAWKAEKIAWSSGSYRYWVNPERISNPSTDEIYLKAVQLYKSIYEEQIKYSFKEEKLMGKNAIRLTAEHIRTGTISNEEKGHLSHFAFAVGTRRALDFSNFLKGRHEQLASLKDKQAQLFGKCQTLAVLNRWDDVAKTLDILADVESQIESAMFAL